MKKRLAPPNIEFRSDGAEALGSDRNAFWVESCTSQPLIDVVVPVYNEQRVLASSIRHLSSYLEHSFPLPTMITIVDNASTDDTPALAAHLATELSGVRMIRLEDKGRGGAVRTAWNRSEAQIVAYMDVDLSTSLDALLPLVAPLLTGHSEIAIGTRLRSGARVVRSRHREVISRAYNLLLKVALKTRFSDAQCGFKATRSDVARKLLTEVEDDGWFFDTELLVCAERHGMRISEVSVDWVENSDSRVKILRTAKDDLEGIVRLLREHP